MTKREKKTVDPMVQADLALSRDKKRPRVGDIYRHYKGGRYRVVAVGIHDADLVPMVCYKPTSSTKYRFRTLANWCETVTLENGDTCLRFDKVDP